MASALITSAIQSGAPLYNAGQKSRCAEIYTAVATRLLTEAALAAQLNITASTLLRNALQSPASDPDARAWQLRQALDSQLAATHPTISQQLLELPPDANPTVSKLARSADGSKEESDAVYRARLSPAQYAVLRQKRTEPRHGVKRENGGFDDVFDAGTYCCGACGTAVYTSDMKYNCGCGWPGFWTNIDGAVRSVPDSDGKRNELVCNACNSHLGHVFIGEKHGYPTDERHCINSCSLSFLPEGATVAQPCSYYGPIN